MTHTLEIVQDDDAPNPRTEFDNASHFVCFHRRYDLGDKHNWRTEFFSGWDEMEAKLVEAGAAVIRPLFLLDHSGLQISTYDFNDHWDSGRVGFVYMTRQDILDEVSKSTNKHRRMTPRLRDKALKLIEGEVVTYNHYLTGNVWGYVIRDEDGEVVDSCYGFYGREYAEEQGQEALASFNAEERLAA